MELNGRAIKVLQNLMHKRQLGFFKGGGPVRAQRAHRETLLVFYPQPGTRYKTWFQKLCVKKRSWRQKSFLSHLREMDKMAPPRGLGLVLRYLLSGT